MNQNYSGHIRAREVKSDKKTRYQLVVEQTGSFDKRKRMYRTLKQGTTKKEAEKALRQWLNELDNDHYVEPGKLTMGQLFTEYERLFLREDNKMLSPTTIVNYKKIIDKDLKLTFGDQYVQQLNVRDIQKYVNEFYGNGEAHTAKTVHNHLSLLKLILDWSVATGAIGENPCESKALQLPKKEKPQLTVLQKEDVQQIIQCAEGSDMEFLTKLLFTTGCRRGEIISITYDDWDPEEKSIRIGKNRVRAEQGSVVKKPKMDKVRTIYVGDQMNRLIQKQLTEYKERKLYYGPDFVDSDLMICQRNGDCYQPDSISKKWKKFLERNGLPVVGMHACRHAFASLSLASGSDIASISRYLGHAQTSTTLNQYVSFLDEGVKQVAKDMDTLLLPEKMAL